MANEEQSSLLDEFGKTLPCSREDLARMSDQMSMRVSRDWVSLLIYSRDGARFVPLKEGSSVIIGRSPPADVIVRDNNLSRQHALLQVSQGALWVEDLGSTNGTWVDGVRIQARTTVEGSAELSFGAVAASVHELGPAERRHLGLGGHDGFQIELTSEVSRARTFGRSLALLMVRTDRRSPSPVSRWFPRIQELLRPFDRMAFYSADTVEVLLPEATYSQAEAFGARIVQNDESLLCGVGVLPFHAASADELVEVTRMAALRASRENPVRGACDGKPAGEGRTQGGEPQEGPVFRSAAMEKINHIVERIASSPIPVLIVGETGTGKEVLSRAIHEKGKRQSKPMVTVNCGAIPPQLVESTLFGHERGAFTGANQQSKGVFESAHGGTVLLDEIGELPLAAQVALLRVLETKRFTRVGATQELEVDVRVIAATHRSLEKMCAAGEFRSDLLYRLNAMKLTIPPLRERMEEIEPLCWHFIRHANQANECQVKRIAPDALQLLLTYPWPGNVRELRNAMERAVVIAQDDMVTVDDLPELVRDFPQQGTDLLAQSRIERCAAAELVEQDGVIDLREELNRFETDLILRALDRTGWDRNQAADLLTLPVRTLGRKMQMFGIKR